MGAYELFMREFRIDAHSVRTANANDVQSALTDEDEPATESASAGQPEVEHTPEPGLGSRPRPRVVEVADEVASSVTTETARPSEAIPRIQLEVWRWTLDNRHEDGYLPTGREIAARFSHKERWGRLIKQGESRDASTKPRLRRRAKRRQLGSS
ncbi:hypothetical protein F4561_003653 [Lipingzhangella halophila]|uniref:Uncharacterized protein n=1 Tax=Lipingzhangella halophila TaxID=1783352 RepID=A0A7W7W3S4_9ACTN|nr:hypothetical protein [Lipingzhangella halophila]MBB4932833.1 hypothetical protein [Lipingzhangella halophila]